MVDLGLHRMKDLTAPERIWQVGGGAFPALRTLDVVRHNLPVERTPLIGRKVEIDQIVSLVDEHRLVTVLGMGGSGKTRLATAVAAEMAARFTDGVWFVDLVPSSTAGEVVEAVAAAAGLQIGGADVTEGLGEVLATRDALFVLDNCEHITDDVADVVDLLLGRTTGLRVLATSREPLVLLDERRVQIAPLEVSVDLAAPAVQLFAVTAERVGVAIPGDELETVARVCERLDGLPLSIELAAAQLRHLSLAELAGRLDQRFELLSWGRRGGRQRRQAQPARRAGGHLGRCWRVPNASCCYSLPPSRPRSLRRTSRRSLPNPP